MTFIEDMHEAVGWLGVFGELDVDAAVLPGSALGLSDQSVRDALEVTAGLAKQVGLLQSVLAGLAAARSTREHGHTGLVQESGHRNAVEFIRDLTGTTRGEAIRAVKVGEALLDGATAGAPATAGPEGDTGDDPDAAASASASVPVVSPWHEPLRVAALAGRLTTAQLQAIRAGLGEPPLIDEHDSDAVIDAWRAAAEALAQEAPMCTVEDLAARARCVRDMLDPVGAEQRYAARYQGRSYRSSIGPDGVRRGHLVYDDEGGEWIDHLIRTALAPRRGGPRFVADDQKRAAEDLMTDPRSNEQLAYDLLLDVIRAGAFADVKDVFGAKEPGVRLVTLKDTVTEATSRRDAFGRLIASACTEDGGLVVPGSVLERALCVSGTIDLLTDTAGNPLDVGRELRLFTARQRLSLAVRDGGCLWPGCDRPPEMCEAHHCDHWVDGGSTDCDRGVLLCRYHHLHLHNTGWRITREGVGPFILHPPPGVGSEQIVLRSKSPLRWLWDPPPDREHWRSAA